MPSQPRSSQTKPPREGAGRRTSTPKRGAASGGTRMMMMAETVKVKQERQEGEVEHVSSYSRQRLRSTILERWEAQGLDKTPPDFAQETAAVKYELTPMELEKRQRRKEQNRRAARKCRLKKRQQQDSFAQSLSKLIADNRAKEHEVSQLKADLAQLARLIEIHNQSCPRPLPTLPWTSEGPSDVGPASPAPVTSSVASPQAMLPAEEGPAPMETAGPGPAATATSAEAVAGLDMVDMYLQDLGPIVPDSTFTDLDTFINLEDLDTIPSPELLDPSPDQQQHHNHHNHHQQQVPQPLRSPPQTSPFDPEKSLRRLQPSSSRVCCHSQSLLCPVSPATNQGRLSVSSAVSDWSEQFQGLHGVPSGYEGSPALMDVEEGGSRLPELSDESGAEAEYAEPLSVGGFGTVPDYETDDDRSEEDEEDVFIQGHRVFHSWQPLFH